MTGKALILGTFALVLTASAPAFAQDSMMSNDSMMKKDAMMKKMSKADMATMKRCKGMSKTAMKKSATCAKMMKAHPGMM